MYVRVEHFDSEQSQKNLRIPSTYIKSFFDI